MSHLSGFVRKKRPLQKSFKRCTTPRRVLFLLIYLLLSVYLLLFFTSLLPVSPFYLNILTVFFCLPVAFFFSSYLRPLRNRRRRCWKPDWRFRKLTSLTFQRKWKCACCLFTITYISRVCGGFFFFSRSFPVLWLRRFDTVVRYGGNIDGEKMKILRIKNL